MARETVAETGTPQTAASLAPSRTLVMLQSNTLAGPSLLPLTCLAPDIVEAILDGRQPKGLRLAELLGNGLLDWNEQRRAWGFA
jgi:hypothetical protein